MTSRIPRIKAGPIVVGEDHPLFDLGSFPASVSGSSAVEASWVEGSVKWARGADALALPQARLRVFVKAAPERVALFFHGRTAFFQADGEGAATEIFVPLFENAKLEVDIDGKRGADIKISARPTSGGHAVDHSCSPWALKISGLDDSFLSANCRLLPVGHIGSEEPYLEIRWATPGSPTYTAQLRGTSPAKATIPGPDGKPRRVEISASVPPRFHRLRLAGGFGPYTLASSAGSGNGATASAMLYTNFRMRHDDDLSLRAFEAAVSRSPSATSFFNNLGFYFVYDLKRVWDKRLNLTALLGTQIVTFAPRGLAHGAYDEGLLPQGFEISYVDAFGLKNKSLSAGLFLQPTANKHYQNYWVRFGGRVFGEVNYISWRSGDRYAKMGGVSVGIPLAQLF
jgi:hypothetical protein